jgi:hypothetical protein
LVVAILGVSLLGPTTTIRVDLPVSPGPPDASGVPGDMKTDWGATAVLLIVLLTAMGLALIFAIAATARLARWIRRKMRRDADLF